MKKIFSFCNTYLKRQQGKLYCYIAVSVLLGLLPFVTPLVTGEFIDELTRGISNGSFIWKYVLILLGAGIIQFIFGYVKDRLYQLIQMKCAIDINMDTIL